MYGVKVDGYFFVIDADPREVADLAGLGKGANRRQDLYGGFAHDQSAHSGVAAQDLEVDVVAQLFGEHFLPLSVAEIGFLHQDDVEIARGEEPDKFLRRFHADVLRVDV